MFSSLCIILMELPCGRLEIKRFCHCWHVCMACISLRLLITSVLLCVSLNTAVLSSLVIVHYITLETIYSGLS